MSLWIWKGPTTGVVMSPNSPTLVYTDRVKATDVYMGLQSVCAANMLARGTFGSGFRTGWVVNQCTVSTARGRVGTLTYEWEAGGSSASQPLPVGNFSLKPQELYPKIERAACFNGITLTTLNLAKSAMDSQSNMMAGGSDAWLAASIAAGVNGYTSGTYATQLALAQNLVAKWGKGEETFYLAGWRYTYEVYSYTAPTVNRGGVAGTPSGPLSGALPSGVSWLRLADDCEPAGVGGSMYKLTVNWLGGPIYNSIGYWDSDVYV